MRTSVRVPSLRPKTHINEPHRVAPVIRVGAGHSGDAQAQIGAQPQPHPFAQGAAHLVRHGAAALQQLFRHAHRTVFDGVGVAHDAAPEHGGYTGHIRHMGRDQPAGAALRRGEGDATPDQGGADFGCQVG